MGSLRQQVAWIGALVDRCLDVTKLSSEPLLLTPRETDLREVVLDVVDRSREWIDQAGCAVSLERLESAVGRWDRVRLESAFTNLLANALKYGRGKPVEVWTGRAGERALLAIRDHGIGLSADELAGVFSKFSRAVPKENYGGLGLGLWVVDQITRAHGGSVHAESRKGEGATFTVELPL